MCIRDSSSYQFNVAEGDVTIGINAHITDDISGVFDGTYASGLGSSASQARWSSPSGNQFLDAGYFSSWTRGDSNDAYFDNQSTVLSQYSELGTWTLDSFLLAEEAGNTTYLNKEELDNFVDSVRLISRDQAVKIEKIDIQENEVVVFFGNKEKIKDVRDSFFQMYRGVTLQINNNKLSIKLNDEYRKIIQDSAIKQSLEIVRKRIDESGTKEPLIQRSGKKRILLQLPGVKDPERIKDLLGKTAKLTFHIVDNDNTSALQNNLAPFGKIIVPDMYDENTKYLLDKRAVVGGENLVDAKGSFDQTEGHAVSFRFDTEGAQKFGKVTTNNIGKNLAVVLDLSLIHI